jgi:hypothetical protein
MQTGLAKTFVLQRVSIVWFLDVRAGCLLYTPKWPDL